MACPVQPNRVVKLGKRSIRHARDVSPRSQPIDLLYDAFCRNPEMTIEIFHCPRLPKMLDTERDGAMAANRAELGKSGRMAIDNGDKTAVRWQALSGQILARGCAVA